MKKERKILFSKLSKSVLKTAVAAVLIAAFTLDNIAYAEDTEAIILETDVPTASENCTILGVRGSYYSNAQEALDKINEIRLEACQEGVIDPYTQKPLTVDDYKPLKWSTALEKNARIRAAENNLSLLFVEYGHFRMNKSGPLNIYIGDIVSSAENLAFTSGSYMMTVGIGSWYKEKSAYVNETGGSTGHYEALISTQYNYVGMGNFFSNAGVANPTCVSAEFSRDEGSLGQEMLPDYKNIIQKIEVHNDYIDGYYLLGNDSAEVGKTEKLIPMARLKSEFYDYEENLNVVEPVSFSSSDPSVATVDENGVVTAIADGTTTITAYSENKTFEEFIFTVGCKHSYVYEANGDEKTIVCTKCNNTIVGVAPPTNMHYQIRDITGKKLYQDLEPNRIFSIGDEAYLQIGCSDGDSGYQKFTVTSSNSDVVEIPTPSQCEGSTTLTYMEQTQFILKSTGISKITMCSKYNSNNKVEFVMRVGEKGTIDITDPNHVSVSMPQTEYTYNGSACEPKPTVTYDGIKLSAIDCIISYENNTGVGEATCVITGNSTYGLFKGSMSVPFNIVHASIENATVTLATSSYDFDNTEKKPGVTVKYSEVTLNENVDYTLTYSDNILPGTATVKVQGIGNYKGAVTKTFKINHSYHTYGDWEVVEEPTCTKEGTRQRYCLCGYCQTDTISKLSHTEELTPTWSDDYKTCKVTGACSSCGKIITAGIYPTVVSEVKKQANCKETGLVIWTAQFTYKNKDYTFTKEQITEKTNKHNYICNTISEPSCIEEGLREYKCSVCEYSYTEKISAKGHDYKEVVKKATLTEDGLIQRICCNCNDEAESEIICYPETINVLSKAVYTGAEIKPEVTVIDSDSKEISNSNYTVTYSNNKDIGTGEIVFDFKGNYTGTVTKTFNILPPATKINSISNGTYGVVVKWDKVSSATGYRVYRSESGASFKLVKLITDNSILSYTDTKTTYGLKYQYKIVAYKPVGGVNYYSSFSPVKTMYSLRKPEITAIKNSAASTIALKWSRDTKATGYQITIVSGSYTKKVIVTGASNVSKTITGLTKGKSYKVYVRSFKTVDGIKYYSGYSSAQTVKVIK